MQIFPAIDLKDGQCVRLTQGVFDAATIYENEPLKQARRFAEAGASWIHVVDLNGAMAGEAQQTPLIAAIAAQEKGLKIQVGGGIRRESDIQKLLQAGIERIVVGSLAVQNPHMVRGWLRTFGGDKIVVALDVRLNPQGEPEVLTRGWQDGSANTLWDVLSHYEGGGLRTVLCTDVGRDGMLSGSNKALYAQIKDKAPTLEILASGGVSDLADLHALKAQGLSGAIVGKALYEGKIDLATAIKEIT